MTLTSRGQQEGNYLNKTKHLLLIVNIQARNTYALCMIMGWKSWIVHLSILVPPSLPHFQLYCIIATHIHHSKFNLKHAGLHFSEYLHMILSESHSFKKTFMCVLFKQTKWLEESSIHHQRKVCCFTRRSRYDILIKNDRIKTFFWKMNQSQQDH